MVKLPYVYVELGQGVCAYYKLIAIFRRLVGDKI